MRQQQPDQDVTGSFRNRVPPFAEDAEQAVLCAMLNDGGAIAEARAKLGPDHEALIGTVRNVGYRLVPDRAQAPATEPAGA